MEIPLYTRLSTKEMLKISLFCLGRPWEVDINIEGCFTFTPEKPWGGAEHPQVD